MPVALAPGLPKEYEIAATLTLPPEDKRKSVVQLLVHGATYARYYWDFPYRPARYSYVEYIANAGYPTLNIDRIGCGDSSHPLPELLTVPANAFVLDQLVEALRAGAIGDVAFGEVTLVGHSLGSVSAIAAQSDFESADALIVTGLSQQYQRGLAFLNLPIFYPATLDDDDDINDLPLGYLTTRPGTRDYAFYYEPNAEQRVIAIDERHKQTVTDSELATIPTELPDTLDISVPVLEVLGNRDVLFCTTRCSQDGTALLEPTFWPAADPFELEVIPRAGHDLNLHRNAPQTYSVIRDFADNYTDAGAPEDDGDNGIDLPLV